MARRSKSRSLSRAVPIALWPQTFALPGVIAAAIVLGGASAAGVIPNLILQLVGIGLVVLAVIQPAHRPADRHERSLLYLGLVFVAIAVLQLVPLPPFIWSALPGHGPVAEEFRLLHAPLPWLPLNLNPTIAVRDLLGLAVAAGVFATVHRAVDGAFSAFAWTVVLLAGVSTLIGFAQLVSGGHSPLYFYAFTNRDQPVGFFANSNHLATLELVALPMLAALLARTRGAVVRTSLTDYVVLGSLAVLLVVGLVVNGSLAGLGLLIPVMVGCFFVAQGPRLSARMTRVFLIGLAGLLVVVSGFIALAMHSPLLAGYAQTSLSAGSTSRLTFVQHTSQAIAAYFPFGSGLGSFTSVFPSFEDPTVVDSVFVNHAHNEYLELALELGLPGIALILAALAWWGRRVWSIWRDRDGGALARAASVATAAVLAHSVVDYPLRTAAISAVFAACCAIMARPARTPPPPVLTKDQPAAQHLSA